MRSPSPTLLLALAVPLGAGAAQALSLERRAITSCSSASQQKSCHASQTVDPSSDGTCCYNGALTSGDKEGGLVVQTQFWDTDPSTGPRNSATIHGLWPDYCDGTYPASCSSKSGIPTYTGAQIRAALNRYSPSTLSYMNTYYKDVNGDDESFWEHEWNKHGTCYTTLRARCQNPSSGMSAEDAALVGYFEEMVRLFKTLPTYKWLSDAGITPSSSKAYRLSDLQAALSTQHGADVYIGCTNRNVIDEFWYYYNVKGPLIDGTVRRKRFLGQHHPRY